VVANAVSRWFVTVFDTETWRNDALSIDHVYCVLVGICGNCDCSGRCAAVGDVATMSRTEIVFLYGGYLWSVPRDGGEARN